MRYWIGVVFFAAAAGFVIAGLAHKRRVLAARAAAAARGILPAEPGLRSVAAFGEIMRPVILFFLAYAAVKTLVLFVMLGGEEQLSYFDLAGVLAVLAGYGAFMSWRIGYRTSDLAIAESAAAAAADTAPPREGADATALPAFVGAPANDSTPPDGGLAPIRGAR
ncbi:hypothetical protein PQJ75_23385 [Rhodoplanes sp. TEM]|uniref:NADH-quinone oxidoreductase subunit n=1 Tax=Rhodoplanes tepidamans TaxID=200616 RepID=A0ABT5J5R3_RHOTP|nr:MULTISPECIES: hypothetical protein [Rhodoplanes]MDC7784992.1 hypothetical protein [Rhodoplanes tepidamans]MDC7986683.1 hypothetical protein [Rhodoplanes sp. TEM]MDQ0353777.1 hypothetical protein [Rhodoplanes tepidamans]